MCGIVGQIGENNAAPILLDALKRLEYRGYDSSGIAAISQAGLSVSRAVGKLAELGHSWRRDRGQCPPAYGW